MKTYEGIGGRIRQRLLAIGYVRRDGEPDVASFCFDHRFGPTSVYGWLKGTMTPFKDLVRLCTALQCSVEWLLVGQERVIPKALPRQRRGRVESVVLALALGGGLVLSPSPSVAARARPLGMDLRVDPVHLIGSKRRFRNKISIIGAGSAYAA